MKDINVLIRWEDGAAGLTGWGWIVFWFLVSWFKG